LTVDDNTSFEPELWTPAIIIDPTTSEGHLLEVFASASDPTSFQVRPPGNCSIAAAGTTTYTAGSLVVRAVHQEFFVDDTTYTMPVLMLDPDGSGSLAAEPVAEGIEEIQIAVGVEGDGNTDSLTDNSDAADEWFYNDPGDAALEDITLGNWQALRISVLSRQTRDEGSQAAFFRPDMEDHAGSSTADAFKRRVLSTTVELRNFSTRNN
jgi:hypothetical protein